MDPKNYTSTDTVLGIEQVTLPTYERLPELGQVPLNSADMFVPAVAAAISNPVSVRPLVATVDVGDLSDPAAQQQLAAAIQSQIVDAIPEELS
jgi:hypothetical protein